MMEYQLTVNNVTIHVKYAQDQQILVHHAPLVAFEAYKKNLVFAITDFTKYLQS
jgi:hypothetical protein